MDLVFTLTGALTAALVLGFAAQRVGLSPIVGYLGAGVAVGPFTPGFVAHGELATELGDVGIILLMFGVGLSFHVKELLAVRKTAVPGALVGVAAAVALALLGTRMFGWSIGSGLVFGLAIAITSTVVLMRVLADNDALHTPSGHISVGWLVVEDLLTVLVLVLLPVLAGQGANATPIALLSAVGIAVLKVALLVVFTLAVGKRVVPAVLGYVAKTRSRELFTLAVLVVALGIAVGSAKFFGASMALGAFLAGLVVGQSHFSARAASDALPMRDAFAVLFFVSVGMLFDPSQLRTNLPLMGLTVAIVLLGKPLAAFVLLRVLRHPVTTALSIAASLAQIGEFSFVIAALGRKEGLISVGATQAIVVAAMVSITLNAGLFRAAVRLGKKVAAKQAQPMVVVQQTPLPSDRYHAIVVGYGPVGRTVTRILQENSVHPTVIELNHETVADLLRQGISAVHGDAAQTEVLVQAGAKDAKSLIFAASGSSPEAVIHAARAINPTIGVLARSAYIREIPGSLKAGADVVIAAETEVALAMTEHLLTELGASGEQLDRARARVRTELVPT